MKKKIALISVLVMLCTAGCGSIDNADEVADESLTTQSASDEEETSEAETEAASNETDKLGTEFNIFPDIKLGMTEDELKAVIGDDYERSVEKLQNVGPEIAYYTVPFESCPELDADMAGHKLFTFIPDGELICISCHFGVKDRDDTPVKEYSEDEIKALYDTLFDKIHEHYGDHYSSADNEENCLSSLSWNNIFGNLYLSSYYYEDTKTGKVSISSMGDDFAQKILSAAKTSDKDDSASGFNESEIIAEGSLFSQLNAEISKEQAFATIGKEPAVTENRGSYSFYEWNFDKDDAFGTDFPFSLYIEFDDKNDRINSYGYELGVQKVDGNYDLRCNYNELKEKFGSMASKFKAVYGSPRDAASDDNKIYIWDDSDIVMFLTPSYDEDASASADNTGSGFICIARSYE